MHERNANPTSIKQNGLGYLLIRAVTDPNIPTPDTNYYYENI
jgi:hypothetical protein